MYFPKHKLAVEVDEKGLKKKWKRERNKIKTGCELVRINPDRKDYDEYVEFGKIYNHINKSTKKLTKESLIDTFSTILSKIKLKSDHSTKSKVLKCVKKHCHCYKTCKLIA